MNEAKKRGAVTILIAAFLAALLVLCLVMLHSSVRYDIMSSTEQLKAQLQREYPALADHGIEKVEVQRPWYSLSPTKWTFVVTFSSESETVSYRRTDSGFEPIRS